MVQLVSFFESNEKRAKDSRWNVNMAPLQLTFVYFCLLASFQLKPTASSSSGEDNSARKEMMMMCADLKCEEIISEAFTLGYYPSRDKSVLSFKHGERVKVYAKPALMDFKLVFGEINGKKGFIPWNLIREQKILRRDLQSVLFPLKTNADYHVKQADQSSPSPSPDERETQPSKNESSSVKEESTTQNTTNKEKTSESTSKSETSAEASVATNTNVISDDTLDTTSNTVLTGTDSSKQNAEQASSNVPDSAAPESNVTEGMKVTASVALPADNIPPRTDPVNATTDTNTSTTSVKSDSTSAMQNTTNEEEISKSTSKSEDSGGTSTSEGAEKGKEREIFVSEENPPEASSNYSDVKSERVESTKENHITMNASAGSDSEPKKEEHSEVSSPSAVEDEATQKPGESKTPASSPSAIEDEATQKPDESKTPASGEGNVTAASSDVTIASSVDSKLSDGKSVAENVFKENSEIPEENIVLSKPLTADPLHHIKEDDKEATSEGFKTPEPVSTSNLSVTPEAEDSAQPSVSGQVPQQLSPPNSHAETDSTASREQQFSKHDSPSSSDETVDAPNPVSNALPEGEGELSEDFIEIPLETPFETSDPSLLPAEFESRYNSTASATEEESHEDSKISDDRVADDSAADFINQESSVVFSVVPKEYIEILRIYVTLLTDMLPDDVKLLLHKLRISSHLVVFSFVWGFLWIGMYLVGLVIQSFSKDNSLRSQLCDFQLKFFKLKAERDTLRKELKHEEAKRFEMEEKVYERDHKIAVLDKEVHKLKIERDELHEKVITLESDLQKATDAGLELNQILSDFLTSQKENINLNAKVDVLQEQLSRQEQSITQLQKNSQFLEEENVELKQSLEKSSVEVERLTRVLNDTRASLKTFQTNNELLKTSKSETLVQLKKLEKEKDNLMEEVTSLQSAQKSYEAREEKLEAEISDLKAEVESRSNELESLRDIMKTLHAEGAENNVNDIYDIAKLETKLKLLQKDKTETESKLEKVIIEQEALLNKVKALEETTERCKETEARAVAEKTEAQNKLEILTTYFKKREVELQSEIGKLQVTKDKTEEDVSSLANRMKKMEEENESYRSQLESMKKEYLESERNWKAQLAVMEKQAHENWVAARKAEREIAVLNNNSAMWRQHLTLKAKSSDGSSSHTDDEPMSLPDFAPPPPPPVLNSLKNISFDENSEDRHWDPNSNALPPPPPPIPHFGGVDFDNMPIPPPPFPPMPSHHQSMPFAANHPLHWDSPNSRDAFSPVSHQSHDRRSSRGNSPSQSISSVPYGRGAVLNPAYSHAGHVPNPGLPSNPVPGHWSRPNGNIQNTNLQNASFNKHSGENRKSSRSDSRNSYSAGSLHASNV